MPALLPTSAPRWFTDPLVGVLHRLGITPNMLTVAGVAGNVAGAVLAGYGEFLAAGLVVLAFSALDMLDGALARATGQATPFGSVFDAVMDRVSEAALLFGLLVYFSDRGERTEELLIFAAAVFSFLVSYVRARAQVIGLNLREGLFTRAERVLLMSVALIIDQVTPMLWLLATLAGLTTIQRVLLTWQQAKEVDRR